MLCLRVWLEGRRLERSLGGGHRRPSRKARLRRKKKKKKTLYSFFLMKKNKFLLPTEAAARLALQATAHLM